jgi:hypothetical protein
MIELRSPPLEHGDHKIPMALLLCRRADSDWRTARPHSPKITVNTTHQMVVISGVLNVTGQSEQLAVRQSPDPRIEGPLIEALKNWRFQSAQVDEKPVALKVLMGIRLTAH